MLQSWGGILNCYLKQIQIIAYLCILFFIVTDYQIRFTSLKIFAFFFAILILNISTNPNSILKLENKVLNFLGKISYSIYMWHGVAIIIALQMVRYFKPEMDTLYSNLIYYILTFTFTFIFSSMSYVYFESPILKFKSRFTKVLSTN